LIFSSCGSTGRRHTVTIGPSKGSGRGSGHHQTIVRIEPFLARRLSGRDGGELIRARTSERRERAKARGVKLGRKPKLTERPKREAIRRRDKLGEPVREIARSYNVSHSTISWPAALSSFCIEPCEATAQPAK
jgi:hypothetical protein